LFLISDTSTVTETKGLVLYKACLEGKENRINVWILFCCFLVSTTL